MRWSPKQKQLYRLDEVDTTLVVVCGTIRSGKSMSGLFGYLRYVMTTFTAGDHVVACYSDIVWRGTILKYANLWCRVTRRDIRPTDKGFTITGRDPATNQIVSNHFFRITGRDVSAVSRLQGLADCQSVWATEAPLYPPDLISEFINRMANAPLETRKLVMDCNPEGGPEHWFKMDWIDRIVTGQIDGRYFDFGPNDNPTMTPEKWAATCDLLPDGPEKQRKTEGVWVASAGLIFDFAKWEVIGRKPKTEPKFLDVSIDVADSGVTHALLIGHYPSEFWVIDEWRYDGNVEGSLSPAAQIQKIQGRFASHGRIVRWVSDTGAGFQASLQEAKLRGLIGGVVVPPVKDVDVGISTTLRMLQRGQLRVHKTNAGLITDAGRYIWDPNLAALGIDKPLKKNDHGPDALRYWVMMHVTANQANRPFLMHQGRH